MRISNQSVYDSITFNITKASNAMLQANEVISSGKQINRISDDPVGQVSVMSLRASLDHIDQMQRNINMGRSWLNSGESALTQLHDILTNVKVLCVEMSTATINGTQRENAAEDVEGHLEQVLSIANTQVDGRYIFSGTKTDTEPYSIGTDGGGNTSVDYYGNTTEFEINIAKNINVAVGRVGTDIFGTDPIADWGDPAAGADNIFKTLLDLKESLLNNDVSGIQGAMDELDDQMGRVSSLISDSGAKSIRLDVKEGIIKDLNLVYTDRKSQIEDADIAESVMELKARELAYQAALSSSSKIMNLSLVNFL
jgi:flagellar hook-associated protein 3 FlgL